MEGFVKNKMSIIFSEFKDSIQNERDLCRLKDDFKKKIIPDYNLKIVQELYLLRYLPAYLVEYYMIYQEVLRHFSTGENEEPIKVLSIGAGCGIDLWGLKYAIEDKLERDNYDISYTGIDLVDWSYKEDFENIHSDFLIQNINQINEMSLDSYNIIIFPKSLSEFKNEDFEVIIDKIKNTVFNCSKLIVIVSRIESEVENESLKISKLKECIKEKGYCWEIDSNLKFHPDIEGNLKSYKGIRGYCNRFKYPDDIIPFLNDLKSHCPNSL